MLFRLGRGLHVRPCRSSSALLCSAGYTVPRYSASNSPRLFSTSQALRRHDVAILGGGISGLAAAYYLTKKVPTAKITIFEASDRVGGWLSSTRVPVEGGTVLFEAGPRTLRPAGNGALAAVLLQELDLAKDAIFTQSNAPAARNRFLYHPDHLVRMPHPAHPLAETLWTTLTEPAFKNVLWPSLTEYWKPQRNADIQDESVGDFIARRVSKEAVNQLLSGVMHGIYGGDVWQLSAKSLMPDTWQGEGTYGSITNSLVQARADGKHTTARQAEFMQDMAAYPLDSRLKATLNRNSVFTFTEGLGMLSERMANVLVSSGQVSFQAKQRVKSVSLCDGGDAVSVVTAESLEPQKFSHVISALSPEHTSRVATPTGTSKRLIPSIPAVTVMTVNLFYPQPDLVPAGFGYLIPMATPFEQNPERALGVVFDSAYSPQPAALDRQNWHDLPMERLMAVRDAGELVAVNDFTWYNLPNGPNTQDPGVSGTKLTVMLGGHWWNDWPAYPDEEEGLVMAKKVVERHLGITSEPTAWKVNLQKDCIPQYNVGHEARLKEAHTNLEREFKGHLRVVGNWMSGVGVNDCLRSAYEVASNINRPGTGLEQVGRPMTMRIKPVFEKKA